MVFDDNEKHLFLKVSAQRDLAMARPRCGVYIYTPNAQKMKGGHGMVTTILEKSLKNRRKSKVFYDSRLDHVCKRRRIVAKNLCFCMVLKVFFGVSIAPKGVLDGELSIWRIYIYTPQRGREATKREGPKAYKNKGFFIIDKKQEKPLKQSSKSSKL